MRRLTLSEYDFTTMSDKDVFEAKLKGNVMFGYISSANRTRFLHFCEKAGFIELVGRLRTHIAYKARTDFSYSTMGRYHPETKVVHQGDHLIFDERSRPNEHIKELHDDRYAKEWLDAIIKGEDDD